METESIRPPKQAAHPDASRSATQNSHIVSLDGSKTVRFLSPPAAATAPLGMGTSAKARFSCGSNHPLFWQSLNRSVVRGVPGGAT